MSEIIFLNKIYFLLLIPLIGFVIYIFFKKKNKIKFSFYEDVKKVYKHSNTYYYIFYVLLVLIIVCYTIILANPNKTNTTEKVNKNGVDIVLAFDISYSMEATDLQPSRMDVARNVISSFLGNLKTDRVGVVIFSGKPFTSIPLTFDYNFLKDYVATLSPETINQNNMSLQGTAIGDAMVMGSYLYDNKSKDREKVMIIVTDGEANKGLDPTTALKLLKDKKIKAYTVGIGGLEKTYTYVTDQFGNQLKAEVGGVDEPTLKKIATETGGKYYRATSQTVFKEIFDEINKLEKKDIQVETKKVYDTRYE
ncbi:MAG: VWA domain-containing protein, partial [Candidatus Gracilibacteria bacterium]|nr:VWA domain-containing protein [Candidatus Gracilibacteria bacterium]